MERALVDTSAWIEFYHPRGDARVKQALRDLLMRGEVATVAIVGVELLLGARQPETAHLLQEDLRALVVLPLGLDEAYAAAEIGRRLIQQGQRAPTADLLIAGAAQVHACTLWHYGDEHFVLISEAGGPAQRNLARGDAAV